MKAFLPIVSSETGSLTLWREEQFWKAEVPIAVTPSGIEISLRFEQLENKQAPMEVMLPEKETLRTEAACLNQGT